VSPYERAADELLDRAHLAAAHDLPVLFQRYADTVGYGRTIVYLVDLQQTVLVPFLPADGPNDTEQPQALAIDATLAGRAFQLLETVPQHGDDTAAASQVWIPLLNGSERLGVLSVVVPPDVVAEPGQAARLRRFASMAAELLMTKTLYGDTIVRLRRTADMGLAAEMQWTLLPPLTFASSTVTIAAGLEPAYEVAGDSIDYAVDASTTHLAILDGMGHGLRSAQLATLAVAAYRNGRRNRAGLRSTAQGVDRAVQSAFAGEAFSTGILAELDTDSGVLSWVNSGHPEPLLIRAGRVVKVLEVVPMLPFGLSEGLGQTEIEIEIGSESLEPGDRVLLYTDGVVEARSPEGDFFGLDRLVDLLTRNVAAGLPAPETMRRVVRALLTHQQGQLADDATMLLFGWRTDDAVVS
jgi:hypothetical protein